MGCDIHSHLEIKVEGKWRHRGDSYISGDYRLFAKMGNVWNSDQNIVPLNFSKGIPPDATEETLIDWRYEKSNAYGESWIGLEEIKELQTWYKKTYPEKIHGLGEIYGYLYGYEIDYPPDFVEDVRIINWFDN